MKIGFLTAHSPFDRNNFSGTLHYMREALSATAGVELAVLGEAAFRERSWLDRWLEELGRLNTHFKQRALARYRAHICAAVNDDLAAFGSELDVIIAPVASHIVAQLQPLQLPPIIFITDAIPRYIEQAYGRVINPQRYRNEEAALRNSKRVIYSSHFMAEMARHEYPQIFLTGVDKIEVVPFGLNLDRTPQPVAKTIDAEVRLLFVGKDWIRKGGAKALECLRELRRRGIDAHLTIVGCVPRPGETADGEVTVIPYLNKDLPREQWAYFQLLQKAHFLLLPTTADCTPMVIAEANAFSTPVLASEVGGINTVLHSGRNGVLMQADATGAAYAAEIIALLAAPARYLKLSRSSRTEFDQRLNWRAWATQVLLQAEGLTTSRPMAARAEIAARTEAEIAEYSDWAQPAPVGASPTGL